MAKRDTCLLQGKALFALKLLHLYPSWLVILVLPASLEEYHEVRGQLSGRPNKNFGAPVLVSSNRGRVITIIRTAGWRVQRY